MTTRKTIKLTPTQKSPSPTENSIETPGLSASSTTDPVIVGQPQPVVLGPELRKKELIDLVVQRSGVKKRDAKPVVEAMLGVLGEAIAEGRDLVVPPLGRVRAHREKVVRNKRMMIVKVHQKMPASSQIDPIEDDI